MPWIRANPKQLCPGRSWHREHAGCHVHPGLPMLAKAEGWHSTAWVRFWQRLELHLAMLAALLDRRDLCRMQVVRCASHRNVEANPESSSSTLHLHRVVEPPSPGAGYPVTPLPPGGRTPITRGWLPGHPPSTGWSRPSPPVATRPNAKNFLAPPLPRRRLRRRAKRVGALPNRQHLVPMEAVLHRPCQIASRATKSQAGYPVISRGRREPKGPPKRPTTPLAVGPQARAVMEAAVAANKSRRHRLTLSSS